jgi:bifunctional DNA-binding transcriptional regulator/antitoxin component of YhaV-PrlF toxin-antitoxin module
MLTSTVSSKGQTTIPITIRKMLGLNAGSSVHWQITKSSGSIKHVIVSSPSKESLDQLKGSANDLYKNYGSGREYLKTEKDSWQ